MLVPFRLMCVGGEKNIQDVSMAAKSWPNAPFHFGAKPFTSCPELGTFRAGKKDKHY